MVSSVFRFIIFTPSTLLLIDIFICCFVFSQLRTTLFLFFSLRLYINLIPFFFYLANRGCFSLPLFPLSFTPPPPPPRVSELCVYFYSSLYYAVVLKFRPRLWKCWGRTIYESCFFFFFKRFFLKRRSEKKWGARGRCGERGWNKKEE